MKQNIYCQEFVKSLTEIRICGKVGHLSHVPDGEAAEGRELGEGLHAERLAGNQGDDGGVAGLDELRRILGGLASTTINLRSKIFVKSGLLGIRVTMAASPDLMNFGASSVDFPVRRSTLK